MKTLGKFSIFIALGLLVASAVAVSAADRFDNNAFEAARGAGKTILIDVYAPWCPTCRQQRPIIERIQQERPSLVVFEVDFDSAKDVLRRFGVRYQSTLIVFRGQTEVGRSTGETDPQRIRVLIAKGF